MRTFSLLLALFALAALPARADDPSTLLAEHKAFVGWQAGDGSLRSVVLDGEMTSQVNSATKTYAVVHEIRRQLAERESLILADGTTENSGFTGSLFWASNEMASHIQSSVTPKNLLSRKNSFLTRAHLR